MADETQPAKFTPSQSRGPVHLTATGSGPHLLSLPDNVLHDLFEYLSWRSGYVGFHSSDAFNLAATCRQLNHYYRLSFAVALRLDIGPHSASDILFRALERLPRVRSIDLRQRRPCDDSDESHNNDVFEAFLRVLRKTASMHNSRSLHSRALDIKEMSLSRTDYGRVEKPQGHGTEVEVSAECMRMIVETFSSLETLCTYFFFPAAGDDAIAVISRNLSNSLRTLKLLPIEELSDVGGVHMSELHCLRRLEMRSCTELTDITFNALGALEELVELTLSDCAISDAAACRLLGRLRKLTKLYLWCRNVTSAIFRFLPQSLENLEFSEAILNDFEGVPFLNDFEGVPYNALEGVPNLTSLKACCHPRIDDLSFLWPVAARLQILFLTGTSVSDADMAHWIRQMPNLLTLGLAATNVSDETARAVSSLGKITEAHLDRTKISIDGVRALVGGVACQSLECLSLDACPSVSMEDVAVEELDRILAGNRKRNEMVARRRRLRKRME